MHGSAIGESLQLCKIHRNRGRGGEGEAQGDILAKTRSIGDADEKLNTSPASQITCLNRGPSLVLNEP